MNLGSLQTLTWGTVAAAVASALALATVEPPGGTSGGVMIGTQNALPLPTEPTAAGPAPGSAASAVVTGNLAAPPGSGGL
jgi:hypothetical protein